MSAGAGLFLLGLAAGMLFTVIFDWVCALLVWALYDDRWEEDE